MTRRGRKRTTSPNSLWTTGRKPSPCCAKTPDHLRRLWQDCSSPKTTTSVVTYHQRCRFRSELSSYHDSFPPSDSRSRTRTYSSATKTVVALFISPDKAIVVGAPTRPDEEYKNHYTPLQANPSTNSLPLPTTRVCPRREEPNVLAHCSLHQPSPQTGPRLPLPNTPAPPTDSKRLFRDQNSTVGTNPGQDRASSPTNFVGPRYRHRQEQNRTSPQLHHTTTRAAEPSVPPPNHTIPRIRSSRAHQRPQVNTNQHHIMAYTYVPARTNDTSN